MRDFLPSAVSKGWPYTDVVRRGAAVVSDRHPKPWVRPEALPQSPNTRQWHYARTTPGDQRSPGDREKAAHACVVTPALRAHGTRAHTRGQGTVGMWSTLMATLFCNPTAQHRQAHPQTRL